MQTRSVGACGGSTPAKEAYYVIIKVSDEGELAQGGNGGKEVKSDMYFEGRSDRLCWWTESEHVRKRGVKDFDLSKILEYGAAVF